MRGCVLHAAGDLRTDELPEPELLSGAVEVAVELGGICGSDLHYWQDGGVGDFHLREPLILGHEVVGSVVQLGAGVTGPAPGTRVAVHPATVCDRCAACRSGRRHLCTDVRYLGSASRFPHVQGGFRNRLVVPAEQVVPLPAGLSPQRAVLAEPLAVAVHALHRAGDMLGTDVLVTGAGPIGVLVAAAARAAGAASVTVTDLVPQALAVASSVGADRTIALGTDDDPPVGSADVVIEASGAPPALSSAFTAARRGGTIVLLGMLPPGEVGMAGWAAVTRELTVRGSFRFDGEFTEALALLAGGLPVDDVVTSVEPLTRLDRTFARAADRSISCKVLLDLRG